MTPILKGTASRLGLAAVGMFVGLRGAMESAIDLERACDYAKALGLSEEDVQEVLSHVRGTPYLLSVGVPEQLRRRAVLRAMGDEWRYPVVLYP